MTTARIGDDAFHVCLERLTGIEGWLRDEQAAMLWEAASRVRAPATIVEIGSYHGRSTIVLATAADEGVDVFAIDPHAGNDRGPGEWRGDADDGIGDHERFNVNLAAAGVEGRVTHVRRFSRSAHDAVTSAVDLLYVDGAHGYGPATADIVGWGDRVVPGGRMIVHDVGNSFFVSLVVIRRLWFSRFWQKIDRHRSMVAYERVEMGCIEHLRSIGANVADLPGFVRNMMVKALRAARVERLAIVIGHRPGERLY